MWTTLVDTNIATFILPTLIQRVLDEAIMTERAAVSSLR